MFKLLLLLMCSVFSLQVGALPTIKSHQDFVHLPTHEKDKIVIKTMELISEIESNYKHEVRKYGYSQERFEKYTKLMKKINSLFFIDSAHAASNPAADWKRYADKFVSDKRAQNICIFGGWVSKAYVASGGKTICRHPGTQPGCSQPNKVACNPAFFGFKQASSSSMFCVDAADGAHNSAFLCMQEALSDSGDSQEARLKFLRENLEKNPGVFAGVQEFIYKTCVCEMTDKNFNREYHNYMRPHRTCLGLMKVLGEVIACEGTSPLLQDNSIFKNLTEFVQDKNISQMSPTEADSLYSDFLKNKLSESPAEIKRLCGDNSLTVVPGDKDPKDGGPNPGPGNDTTPGDDTDTTTVEEIVVTATNYKCVKAACTIPKDPAADPICVYDIVRAGNPDAPKPTVTEAKPETKPKLGDTTLKVDFTVGERTYLRSCAAVEIKSADDDGYVCQKASCTVPKDASVEAQCTFDIVKTGAPATPATPAAPTTDAAAVASVEVKDAKPANRPAVGDKEISAVFKVGETTFTKTCPIVDIKPAVEENTSGNDDVTITTTKEKSGDKAFKITAKLPEDLKGYSFSWEVKVSDSGKDLKIEKDWEGKTEADKPKTDTKLPGAAQDDTTEAKTETPAADKPAETPKQKTEIVQKRLAKDYEVCATLTKGEKKVSSCEKIDKLAAAAAPGPVVPAQMPMMNLRPFDTGMSGLGIK